MADNVTVVADVDIEKSTNKIRELSTKLLKLKLQQQESREQHCLALKLWVEPEQWQKFLLELLEVSLF